MDQVGAILFGLVVGWMTYRTLRRSTTTGVSELAGATAVIGGGAITSLFHGTDFSYYCIGLAAGFFLYLIVASLVPASTTGGGGSGGSGGWMGNDPA